MLGNVRYCQDFVIYGQICCFILTYIVSYCQIFLEKVIYCQILSHNIDIVRYCHMLADIVVLPSSVPVQSKFSPVGTEISLKFDYYHPPTPTHPRESRDTA